MKKSDLVIIDGGLRLPLKDMRKRFVSAYVTNTRLMGVLAVYARWEIFPDAASDSPETPNLLHQFFYIDCEESGLETYRSFRGEFGDEAAEAEQALVGGLGAEKIPFQEDHLRFLLLHWKNFNEEHCLPLPRGYEEYSFVFDSSIVLSSRETGNLVTSTFDSITSDCQLVNYFLMRCFGRDYAAACYLTASRDFPIDLYDSYEKATFCKNTIDLEKKYGDGSVSYVCDSLIEMKGLYTTVVSRVVVQNLRITGFEHCDSFPVSSIEAAMMLRKTEFTDVYEVMLDEEGEEPDIGGFILKLNTLKTHHSNGSLFMAYKSTNDHVDESVFMLSNDVRGTYYLTDFGQLIITAYDPEDLDCLEKQLFRSNAGSFLVPTAKYEFIEPVLYEFINSGFEDFENFLGLE